jgi:signal transduction histidine kinase
MQCQNINKTHYVLLRLTIITPALFFIFTIIGVHTGYVAGSQSGVTTEKLLYIMWPHILWLFILVFSSSYFVAHYLSCNIRKMINQVEEISPGNLQKENSRPGTEVEALIQAMDRVFPELKDSMADKNESRADKLMTLGVLAAGIVHEIKTPLSTMLGLVEMLKERITEDPISISYLKRISNSGYRLNNLVIDILDFARPEGSKKEDTDLSILVKDCLNELELKIKQKRIDFNLYIESRQKIIFIDSSQIKRVILNVLTNAIDCVDKIGIINLIVKNNNNGYLIQIENNGEKIKPETIEHLFEPFYSTKPQGTGLGLSIAHQIIHAYSGTIKVLNSPEGLTRFEIFLPWQKKD